MRVAVVHNLPSGGGLRSLATVMRHLAPRHELTLYLPSTAERAFLDLDRSANAVRVFPVKQHAPGSRSPWRVPFRIAADYAALIRLAGVYRSMAEAIRDAGHDVVLLNPCQGFYTPQLVRRVGTPTLFLMQEVFRFVHEPEVPRPYRRGLRTALARVAYQSHKKPLLGWLDRRQACCVDVIVANSHFAASTISHAYGVEPVVVYPEVDCGRFRPLGLERRHHLLSVGAVEAIKRHDFVIRALARLEPDRRPPLEVVHDRADSQEQAYLTGLAEKLGVELRLRPRLSEEALIEAYNRARLFVYAPTREPLGYGPLEAQATGLPVVAVAEGGVEETVLNRETGLLVPRDEQLFAEAVATLLEDGSRRESMGRAGIDHVRRRWSGGFGAGIEALLERASSRRGAID